MSQEFSVIGFRTGQTLFSRSSTRLSDVIYLDVSSPGSFFFTGRIISLYT